MIELTMVRRMTRRGLVLALPALAALYLAGGAELAVSAAAGIALTLANLWLAGRVIGGIAENRPDLLVVGGMAALAVGMGLVVGGLIALRAIDFFDLAVSGLVLIATHFVVVVWEAYDAFLKIKGDDTVAPKAAQTRS